MSLLGAGELLKFAVMIEENGEKFYRAWAEKAESEEQKKFFNHLADEEIKHKKLFEELKAKVGEYKVDEVDIQGQYDAYLRTFTEEVLFNGKSQEAEMAKVSDMKAAVDFAMKQELDSLLFYTDLKNFVPKEHEDAVERIKQEERKHFTDLAVFKKKISS